MTKSEAKLNDKPLGAFQVMVTAYRCRCGYEWLPKGQLNGETERPVVCPECHSPRWDRPFKYRKVAKRHKA